MMLLQQEYIVKNQERINRFHRWVQEDLCGHLVYAIY